MIQSIASVLPGAGPVWGAILGGFGAIFGSFIATLVLRWPAERSVLRGRSACDACGRMLGPRDLVPLVSALTSRGRCRCCGAAIDPLHWQVELGALAIGAIAGALLPGGAAIAAATFGWQLLALAVLDLREFWLPDALVAVLALTGLASGTLGLAPPLADRLIGGGAGFAALWTIGAGYRVIRGREGLGGGDPKLLGAIGLWLGWRLLPAVLMFAALIGLGVAAFAWATRRRMTMATAMPFGTLLALAAYPAAILLLASAP